MIEKIKIRLVEENTDREVELIGKVLCTRSDKYDMSWEFQKDKEYDLYEQTFEDGTKLYIVFNNGWYSNYTGINDLSDKYYDFVLK
jgi:hypothetical protein